MAHPADPQLLVVTSVRLKGFADTEAIAAASGLPASEVGRVLEGLQGRDLARYREGRVSGWTLTPAGRNLHAKLVAAELDAAGCSAAFEDAYQVFLALNPRLLTTASAWQLRQENGQAVVNDHTDAAHDQQVLADLQTLHDDAHPLAERLGGLLERYGRYASRLGAAARRVLAGEHEWFTKPLIDSYHTVWFELHEDLLSTLGKERASEESREPA